MKIKLSAWEHLAIEIALEEKLKRGEINSSDCIALLEKLKNAESITIKLKIGEVK